MTALKLFFNNMHNKEHEDYQFIKNTSYAFIGRTLMFIAIGLSLVFEIIGSVNNFV